MAEFARSRGIRLRPHAKSHKSVDIARRLVAAGAGGACCATIGEAEALAAGGIGGLLITSPLTAPHMLERLCRLRGRGADVMVVADDIGNVARLAEVAAARGTTLPVLVELDVGIGRTGCADVAGAIAVARAIAGHASLSFAGVQAYWGHLQQVMPYAERQRRVEEQAVRVRQLVSGLAAIGMKPKLVTGGGTGTHWIDASLKLFTELQVGSFLFLDSLYGATELVPGSNPFTPSLFVAASVVSASHPGKVIVNAGYKAFATDSGKPVPALGAPEEATYRFMGDEHGAVEFGNRPAPALGAVIEFLTPHCDPTVNLYSCYRVVRGGEVVDEWPISARGY
jgi:D-serine deaminase-like pyridoxal phosphate-dependent protein